MANQVSRTGMLDVNAAAVLIDKSIDAVFMRRDQTTGFVLQPFFDKVSKDSGLTHVIQSAGSALPLPTLNEDTAALPYVAPTTGFRKTFQLLTYRSGIRVTRGILEADRFDRVGQMATGQLKAAMRKDEYMRAGVFNGAFSGTLGADGQYLCADSHPQENADADTWDNLGTGTLTGPNLHALRLLARRMTNDQGQPDQVEPQTLIVSPEKEQIALELTMLGRGKPDTNFNQPNVLLPNFKVVVSPYLSSTTAYFIVGDRMGYDKGLLEIVLSDWSIADNRPANADIMIDKRIRATKAWGFTTSRNVFGSSGT
ncbi:MAG: hypothetical protein ACOYOU_18325 [Kiritimatiellia bacterium]